MIALHLEQRPYVQVFLPSPTVDESSGSLAPRFNLGLLKLKSGRMLNVNKLIVKFNELGG